jgi:hypothetical protein
MRHPLALQQAICGISIYLSHYVELTLESPGESVRLVPQSTMLEIVLEYLIREESRVLVRGILVLLDDIS